MYLKRGGTAQTIADRGLEIIGDVEITGKLTVSEDVVANGISLINLKHSGVSAVSAQTGKSV